MNDKAARSDNGGCITCRSIVSGDEGLERDVRMLRSAVLAVDDLFEEIFQRHHDSEEWYLVAAHLSRAVGNPYEFLALLPAE